MNKTRKPEGFPVIVHNGVEITPAQFDKLGKDEQAKCKHKTNGPHWNAKWARDLKRKEGK